jgi:hypothetical protein
MAHLGRRRLLPVLALAVLVCGQVAAEGAATTARAQARVDARGFPRTYHIWGSGQNLAPLARYDMTVGYAFWDVRALRRRNPGGIFLLGPGLQPKNPREYRGIGVTNGALEYWRGGTDRVRGGPRLGLIRAFDPFWDELYNADGSRALVNGVWRHTGWNLADPRRKGTATLVAKVLAHASKQNGLYRNSWDGVHSDNWIYRIGAGWFYGSNLDTDRDGRVDDYGVLRRNWANGLTRVGTLLRSYLPGKIVGGNGNWNVRAPGAFDFSAYLSAPDDHLRSANYTLLEGLELYAARADEIVATVREWIAYADPRGQPRYFAILHRLSGERDFKSMRWGLSLATIAGAYYEAYAASHADMLWYDEYDGGEGVRRRHWLGQPLSGPQKLPSGVWKRDFEHGVVLNNSTAFPQTIHLDAAFARLRGAQDPSVNPGAELTDVTIPAFDGVFLRRRPSPK